MDSNGCGIKTNKSLERMISYGKVSRQMFSRRAACDDTKNSLYRVFRVCR